MESTGARVDERFLADSQWVKSRSVERSVEWSAARRRCQRRFNDLAQRTDVLLGGVSFVVEMPKGCRAIKEE